MAPKPHQRLATVKDIEDVQQESRRRTDRVFAVLFLALIGVVAGVGWVLIRAGDQQFDAACRLQKASAARGAVTARTQAHRDQTTARWHRENGRDRLADVADEAARAEFALADARATFASSPGCPGYVYTDSAPPETPTIGSP